MGLDALLIRIRTQAIERAIRVTDHAREEMEEESITLAEVLEAIANVRFSRTIQIISAVPVVCFTD